MSLSTSKLSLLDQDKRDRVARVQFGVWLCLSCALTIYIDTGSHLQRRYATHHSCAHFPHGDRTQIYADPTHHNSNNNKSKHDFTPRYRRLCARRQTPTNGMVDRRHAVGLERRRLGSVVERAQKWELVAVVGRSLTPAISCCKRPALRVCNRHTSPSNSPC